MESNQVSRSLAETLILSPVFSRPRCVFQFYMLKKVLYLVVDIFRDFNEGYDQNLHNKIGFYCIYMDYTDMIKAS